MLRLSKYAHPCPRIGPVCACAWNAAEGQPAGASRATSQLSSLQRNASDASSIKSNNRSDEEDDNDDDISIMSMTDDDEVSAQPSRCCCFSKQCCGGQAAFTAVPDSHVLKGNGYCCSAFCLAQMAAMHSKHV